MSTNTFVFEEASRAQAKARIALDGPSGSGKTWTALAIAEGLGGQIGVIDTERKSASKYAPPFRFKTLPMFTFDPRDLPKALAVAAGAGIDVLIIDSLSHFWMGTGGMLEQVDKIAKKSGSGNSFTPWKDVKPIERAMIEALLAYPGHVIITMRTKTEWVITENDRGKKEPKKLGTKAEQREGLEYEFDIVGDLDLDHNMVISKSRMSDLADQVIARPAQPLGQQIRAWLAEGTEVPDVAHYIDRLMAATTRAEAAEVYRDVVAQNVGATPCLSLIGEPTNLAALVIARGHELKALEAQGDPAAVFNEPPAAPPVQEPARPVPAPPATGRVQREHPDGQPRVDAWATPASEPPAVAPVPGTVAPQESGPVPNIPLVTRDGLKSLHTALTKAGIARQPDRLAYCSQKVKRNLGSTSELTWTEARGIAEDLGREQPPATLPQPTGPDPAEQADTLFADLRAGMEGAPNEATLDEVYGQAQQAVAAGTLSMGALEKLRAVGMKTAQQWQQLEPAAA